MPISLFVFIGFSLIVAVICGYICYKQNMMKYHIDFPKDLFAFKMIYNNSWRLLSEDQRKIITDISKLLPKSKHYSSSGYDGDIYKYHWYIVFYKKRDSSLGIFDHVDCLKIGVFDNGKIFMGISSKHIKDSKDKYFKMIDATEFMKELEKIREINNKYKLDLI